MKMYSSKFIVLVSALLLLNGLNASIAQAEPNNPARSLILNEICIFPNAGEPGWVEICNVSQKPVDVSSYTLLMGDGRRFIFEEDFGSVEPNGIVLVLFDGKKSQITDDKSFDNDNLVVLHTGIELRTDLNTQHDPNSKTFVFPKLTGRCSLYRTGPMSKETIADFVCWGGNELDIYFNKDMLITEDASRAKLWRPGRFVPTGAHYDMIGGDPPLTRGGSISRDHLYLYGYRSWYKCYPPDITPGAMNRLPRPVLRDRIGIEYARSSSIGLGWWDEIRRLNVTYELEVSQDKSFTSIYKKVTPQRDRHIFDKQPPGKYYWRVRTIREKEISEWSETGWFRVNTSG